MKIKPHLLIFDLDGTLMNSIPDLCMALNYTAQRFGTKEFDESRVVKLVGGGVRKLVQDAFDLDQSSDLFSEYFDVFMACYSENHSKQSHLFEGVLETLENFKGKKMAILSNKHDQFTKQIAIDYGIDKYFEIILGATDKLRKKPSAEPIEFILRQTNTPKSMAVMIGDSEADIRTAKNSGISSIAVTYGYRTKERLLLEKPDFICNSINELKQIIE
jgi:phosphoglycolate phosphatase